MDRSPSPPSLTSISDLKMIYSIDPETGKFKYVTFYLLTPNDEKLFVGQSDKKYTTVAEYRSALERIPDAEVYPEVPGDISVTIAPDVDEASVHVKRLGLSCLEIMRGTPFVTRSILEETIIMEQISKAPHPNIIGYLGCRVRRNRITAIVLERLDMTIDQFVTSHRADFDKLDKAEFFKGVEGAIRHLHSLGLAHNDISADNIMIKDGRTPILIDFGSCRPFGARLSSLGTPGWYETLFYTSEKKHDEYSLGKLWEWLQNPW